MNDEKTNLVWLNTQTKKHPELDDFLCELEENSPEHLKTVDELIAILLGIGLL